MISCDSIIFDMDGTLWDAVDSYCKVWDTTFDEIGRSDLRVTRPELIKCMGMQIGDIYDRIVADPSVDRATFLSRLDLNEELLMPRLGGRLYEGAKATLAELSKRMPLFMVSNCGADGVHNFLRFTGLAPYITDSLTFGQTHLAKDGNIRRLADLYALRRPVYVGDTGSDCASAHRAGVPFIHAAYGFGEAPDAEASIAAITALPDVIELG